MSYLRRVLARTAGQPLGPLQAAQPRRWSSQAADPFAAADQVASTPATAATNPPRAGVLDDGGGPRSARGSRVRRGVNPSVPSAAPLLAPPVGLRGARPAMLERRASSDGAEPRARIPVATGHDPDAATRPGASAPPSAVAPLATPGLMSRPASVASERRAEPSAVLMPPPLVPRRERAAAADPVRPRHDAPAAGSDPRRPTVVIAAPPVELAAPPQPFAPARPEIVIGRISVIVEGARPPAPATRTVVRHVTATPHNADEGTGLSHRFGLGQL